LETGQEELESANEELKHAERRAEDQPCGIQQSHRDLSNLLENISIPLVMVGRDLRIRRFTSAIEPLLT